MWEIRVRFNLEEMNGRHTLDKTRKSTGQLHRGKSSSRIGAKANGRGTYQNVDDRLEIHSTIERSKIVPQLRITSLGSNKNNSTIMISQSSNDSPPQNSKKLGSQAYRKNTLSMDEKGLKMTAEQKAYMDKNFEQIGMINVNTNNSANMNPIDQINQVRFSQQTFSSNGSKKSKKSNSLYTEKTAKFIKSYFNMREKDVETSKIPSQSQEVNSFLENVQNPDHLYSQVNFRPPQNQGLKVTQSTANLPLKDKNYGMQLPFGLKFKGQKLIESRDACNVPIRGSQKILSSQKTRQSHLKTFQKNSKTLQRGTSESNSTRNDSKSVGLSYIKSSRDNKYILSLNQASHNSSKMLTSSNRTPKSIRKIRRSAKDEEEVYQLNNSQTRGMRSMMASGSMRSSATNLRQHLATKPGRLQPIRSERTIKTVNQDKMQIKTQRTQINRSQLSQIPTHANTSNKRSPESGKSPLDTSRQDKTFVGQSSTTIRQKAPSNLRIRQAVTSQSFYKVSKLNLVPQPDPENGENTVVVYHNTEKDVEEKEKEPEEHPLSVRISLKKPLKQTLSKKTIEENDNLIFTGRQLQRVMGLETKQEIEKIAQTDTHTMLEKVAKDLKLTDYSLSRCVTSGTDHFIKLMVTNQIDVKAYKDYLQNPDRNKIKQPLKPFTRVEVIDGNPVQCLIQAEGRRGHCKLTVRGKIPDELKLYASEIQPDPNEQNSTWKVVRPRTVLFSYKDTKGAQTSSKIKMLNNNDLKEKGFTSIYLKFESIEDCVFSAEVTFPDEDDFIRRRKAVENANVSILARNRHDDPKKSNEQENAQKGRLVAATQFKRKMAKEVKELIDDGDAAKDFIRNINYMKKEKKRRNIAAMVAMSLNPNKEHVDYVRANIEDFYQVDPEQKYMQKLHEKEIKLERQDIAKIKRDEMLDEKTKKNVLQLFRWDLIKERKAESMEIALGIRKQSQLMRAWVRLVHSRAIIALVHSRFTVHRDALNLHMKKIEMTNKIRQAFQRFELKKSQDPRERIRRVIVNSLSAVGMSSNDCVEARAKVILTAFCQKVNQTMQYKVCALSFIKSMYMIIRNFKQRKRVHALKMILLRKLFDREKQAMMFSCQKKAKIKKYKNLYVKMAQLTDHKVEAVLNEYFLVCKMIYRIKSTINYVWQTSFDLDKLIALYQEDETFRRMQEIVKQGLINVFRGTDPEEAVLGSIVNEATPLAAVVRRKTVKLSSPLSDINNKARQNWYETIDQMPETTDLSDDFLGIVCRHAVIGSSEFHSILQRVKDRDPAILQQIQTPIQTTATHSSITSNYNSRQPTAPQDSARKESPRKRASMAIQLSQSPPTARQSKLVQFNEKEAFDIQNSNRKNQPTTNKKGRMSILTVSSGQPSHNPSPRQANKQNSRSAANLPANASSMKRKNFGQGKASVSKASMASAVTPASKLVTIPQLFTNFEKIKKQQTKNLLRAHLEGSEFRVPAMGMIPILRCMPNRHLMQRMVKRAANLPDHFVDFEYHNSLEI